MIRIISDTSTLYSIEEGKKIGVDITPLSVTVKGKSYVEFEEISSNQFLDLLKDGSIPISSQPAVGTKIELYEKYSNDIIIDLAMADGLSGTYQSACSAREGIAHADNIHVVNTRTLCGPHRYLLQKTVALVKEGKGFKEILDDVNNCMDHCKSYLIPKDFDFLKRGGRISKVTASIGGLLKIVPIMTQTPDGTVLEKFDIKRTFKGAVESIIQSLKKMGVNEKYKLFVSHADNLKDANIAVALLEKVFTDIEIELLDLSPAFITQGGPQCVAVQTILK